MRKVGRIPIFCAVGLLVSMPMVLSAQSGSSGSGVERLLIPPDSPETIAQAPAPSGPRVNVIAFLADPPLARALAAARPAGVTTRKYMPWSAAQQRAYVQSLLQKQSGVISMAVSTGAQVQAQLTKSANGVVFDIDPAQIPALKQIFGVTSVQTVVDGETSATLPQVVQYVGAKTLHDLAPPGIDGAGIRIGILDSGIDFTHFDLGGPGTVAAYQAAYGAAACGATPANTSAPVWTSKVVGGFDFVGEGWPNTARIPDPNPIDCQGHGTSVADITAGKSADGSWKGMAPGASLYAIKVCSAVSTSCNGVAILQGFDFALDPNGDNDLSDALDVVNLSLGGAYGLRENPSAYAAQTTAIFGVVVAIASGNDGDVPYVNSSPSSAPEAISVAQTNVPDAFTYPLIVAAPASVAGTYTNTAYQTWSDLALSDITGSVKIDTNTANGGCSPYAAGFFNNSIALVRRGTCNISTKVSNASAAGAIAVIIDNNAAGDAPLFSFGGGPAPFRTTISVQQSLGNSLRAAVGVITATISKTNQISFAGSMVSTSSRGPNNGYTYIKPEIGAPGASECAVVGTGNGRATFGGTSGATPVIAGASALLLQAFPGLSPTDVKARLMATANTNILLNPATAPGVLAPISRIGAGELRVDRAFSTRSALWDAGNPGAVALSVGYQAAASSRTIRKRVTVRNYNVGAKTYSIASSFRSAAKGASGAVVIAAPASVSVPGNSSSTITVQFTINPNNLLVWSATGVNGGSQATNGPLFSQLEYDGYLTLTSGAETISLPWHVLPRRSHNGTADPSATVSGGSFNVSNFGGSTAANGDIFSLTGTSPQLPASAFPNPGDGFQTVDLRAAGVRAVSISGAPGVQFAVSTWDLPTSTNSYQQVRIVIDTNGDGVDDWALANFRTSANNNAAFLQRLGCSPACPLTAYFFTDADFDSSNRILTVANSVTYNGQANQVVINPNLPFKFRVEGVDNFFTGATTDVIPTMTYQLSTPKYAIGGSGLSIPVGASGPVGITAPAGGAAASPSQSGFLILWRDGQPAREINTVLVSP